MEDIFIIHEDWKGMCYLNNDKIYRKDCDEEAGNYLIINNKLIIKWDNWGEEEFYNDGSINNYYSKNIYNNRYSDLLLLEKNNDHLIILNNENKTFIFWNNKLTIKHHNINGTFIINNNYLILEFDNNNIKKYKKINDNIYSTDININNFLVELDIKDFYPKKYIFNKSSEKMYNLNNISDYGNYKILNDSISIKFNNGIEKKITNVNYINYYNSYNEITVIKPNKIIIDNRVLFSNISLCKKKIILTSLYYKYNNWNLEKLKLNIKNNKIINRTVFENDDYESSLTIILDLDKECDRETVYISYNDHEYKYKVNIEQLKIKKHEISAMTLFKNDYELLKRYLKYYSEMGVELFLLYYNAEIDDNIIKKIKDLNINNVKIYLFEWDYIYWWYYDGNLKHHHAQTMAINDSLNILKNYGNYILYNDLDEYFILDEYKNFNELINNNYDNTDIFIFKNRFCTMGHYPIKYKDLDEVFNMDEIIKGNYWDKFREKNLIKSKNVNVMGIHEYFPKFNDTMIIINEKTISEFYHILNFEEKHRLNLMTEYIRD